MCACISAVSVSVLLSCACAHERGAADARCENSPVRLPSICRATACEGDPGTAACGGGRRCGARKADRGGDARKADRGGGSSCTTTAGARAEANTACTARYVTLCVGASTGGTRTPPGGGGQRSCSSCCSCYCYCGSSSSCRCRCSHGGGGSRCTSRRRDRRARAPGGGGGADGGAAEPACGWRAGARRGQRVLQRDVAAAERLRARARSV